VARLLVNITRQPDNTAIQDGQRLDPWGGVFSNNVLESRHTLAAEGSYACACAPLSSALSFGLTQAPGANVYTFAFYNPSTDVVNGVRAYLDYLRFTCVVPPTAATDMLMSSYIIGQQIVPTLSPYGTPATGAALQIGGNFVNHEDDPPVPPLLQIFVPNSTASGATPAATFQTVDADGSDPSIRQLTNDTLVRSAIPKLRDEYVVLFGNPVSSIASPEYTSSGVALNSRVAIAHPPVVIPPGHTFVLTFYFPSNITAAFQYSGCNATWWER